MELAPSGCQVCGPRASAPLSKCSRCKAVQYCSREHQGADFKAHKAVCKRIETYRQRMADGVEQFWGEDTFETQVGHFWELVDTRAYMQAKMGVLREMSTINSRLAIETALAEAMDCHRLCRSDNMGIRDVTPTLMLLLGKLQEAYDFIKWYATSAASPTYDWGNMDSPYLDIHGADMTEQLPDSNGRFYGDVFHASSLTYIKMVLLRDVQDVLNAHVLADRAALPAVVTESLGEFLAPNLQAQSVEELERLREELTWQVREAFALTEAANDFYWDAMLDPTSVLQIVEPFEYFTHGDEDQLRVWIHQNVMLWRDHHEFIRKNQEE